MYMAVGARSSCGPSMQGDQKGTIMKILKKILLWQAEHPVITWAAWGIVWTIVLLALFWPRTAR
jgi:hypothetical protein